MEKVLAHKLIQHYKGVISKIVKGKKSVGDSYRLCEKYHVDSGICNCSHKQFKVELKNDEWINKIVREAGRCMFVCDVPSSYKGSRVQILQALQTRVDIMVKEFGEPKTQR